jgi:hypothetical protein
MRTVIRAGLLGGFFGGVALVSGCGADSNSIGECSITVVVTVSPPSATVNHAAAPPGNQVQFVGTAAPTAPQGCPVPEWVAIDYATWTNPDPTDIQISSANDSTNGTAVCKAYTNGPVTLTGTFTQLVSSPVTKSVQLTCE